MIEIKNKAVKKYRAGNITAAFGADLLVLGSTGIPNLLLKYYSKMNIDDSEMMLLIQLIKLRTERNIFPTVEELGQYVNGGVEQAQYLFQKLIDKEILSITSYYDFSDELVLDGLDFEPLYEKLSELWACDKVKEIEETKNILNKKEDAATTPLANQPIDNISALFEREFARPLSPMEVERIRYWVGEYDTVLITEALRRAVLMGKSNFRYIDAILLEWSKNNLRTLTEIVKYDEEFQQRRVNVKPGHSHERFINSTGSKTGGNQKYIDKKKSVRHEQKEKHKEIFNALLMS